MYTNDHLKSGIVTTKHSHNIANKQLHLLNKGINKHKFDDLVKVSVAVCPNTC